MGSSTMRAATRLEVRSGLLGAAILLVLESQLFRGISYSALFVGLILLAVVMFFRGGVAGLPAQIRGWVHWFADRRDAKAKEGRS